MTGTSDNSAPSFFAALSNTLVRELVPFEIIHCLHSPNTKQVSTREADWLEGYARAYDTRIIVEVGDNREHGLPDGLDEEL